MSKRDLRNHLLSTVAIVNLVFWVGLAGIVGLLLSDKVDLGFETLLRQGQATAVAAWEQQTNGTDSVAVVEAAAAAPISPAATRTVAPAASAAPTQPAGRTSLSPTLSPAAPAGVTPRHTADVSSPTSTPAAVESPTPLATAGQPQPTTTVPVSHSVAVRATPPATRSTGSSPTALPVVSSPTQALRTVPLLLADPGFGNLAQLNAELDRSAASRPVQIRYQEAALNLEIAALVAGNPAFPYRDVVVDLRRDQVVVTGKVTVLGMEVDATVQGTVSARDCRPQFEIESVSVGSLVTPGFVKARVAEMLLDAMDWYPPDYALCIEQIVLEETKACIYGHRR